jgi:SAM-dependent methyltransferase
MNAIAAPAEIAEIEARYERRGRDDARYSPLDPYALMTEQEKDRAISRLFVDLGLDRRIATATLLEIGCGNGANLLRFLRMGFSPDRLVGNELLADRVRAASRVLPASVQIVAGDATTVELPQSGFDVVCLFTVLSSILDAPFQQSLAETTWSLVKPGGGLLCYDFVYNNPRNRDVRGVPVRRLRELFPAATLRIQRVTLAPPLGRPLVRRWRGAYSLFNCIPALRTHVLAWLEKSA